MSIKNELTGRYAYSIDVPPVSFVIKEYKQQCKNFLAELNL